MEQIIKTLGASGTTIATVMSLRTKPVRQLVVTGYSLTSDKAGAVLSVKEFDGQSIKADAVCASGQKVVTVDGLTAPYAQDDVIVVQRADNSLERMEVDTIQEDVSLTMKANLVSPLAVGDTLYRVTQSFAIPVGAATVTEAARGGLGYFVGNEPKGPICMDLDGTSACAINFLSINYLAGA